MTRLQRWTIAFVLVGAMGAINMWTSSAQATSGQLIRLDGGVDVSGIGSVAETPRG